MRIALATVLTALLSASPTLAAPDAACIAEIKAVMAGALQGGPHVIETHVDSPFGDTDTVSEMLPPRGMHSRSVTSMGVSELTYLDGKGWMNFDGTWQVMSPEMVAGMAGVFDGSALELISDAVEAQCLGPVVLDNSQALGFTYAVEASGATTTSHYYVHPGTRLPIRMVTVSPTEAGTITVTSTFRYDASITITPP
jgi:hypothetical protein